MRDSELRKLERAALTGGPDEQAAYQAALSRVTMPHVCHYVWADSYFYHETGLITQLFECMDCGNEYEQYPEGKNVSDGYY